MTALTGPRQTPQALSDDVSNGPVAAGVIIHQGGLMMRDAAGNVTPGATALGGVGIGRAERGVDNSTGAAGDQSADIRAGVFRVDNSSGADEITAAAIDALCFFVDDQTVAATDGGNTRSPAGVVHNVDETGVWVRFDPALTRAYAA